MPTDEDGNQSRGSLTSLPIATAAEILRRAGASRMDSDAIRADVAAGAPLNDDGTVNLLAYGAWLVQRHAQRRSGSSAAGADA